MSSDDTGRRILLVRHGRTEANASGLLLGRTDVPLDGLGRVQATALGDEVRSGRFGPVVAVVSSPLVRALETASAISNDVVVDERLIELDYGDYDGLPLREVPGSVWSRWREDPHFEPPGGESLSTLEQRVCSICDDWFDTPGGGTVVFVSHVSPIKAAVSWSLGVGPAVSWRTHLDNASISQIEKRADQPVLRTFNEIAHLDGLG